MWRACIPAPIENGPLFSRQSRHVLRAARIGFVVTEKMCDKCNLTTCLAVDMQMQCYRDLQHSNPSAGPQKKEIARAILCVHLTAPHCSAMPASAAAQRTIDSQSAAAKTALLQIDGKWRGGRRPRMASAPFPFRPGFVMDTLSVAASLLITLLPSTANSCVSPTKRPGLPMVPEEGGFSEMMPVSGPQESKTGVN